MSASFAVAQTTIRVGPGEVYTTIQAGIDAANAGDSVAVAPGTYVENIDFKGKAITVTNTGTTTPTIIDGGRKGPTVTFRHGETRASTLSHVTVTGGQGGYGGALGGIYISQASPTISGNTITANQCYGINSQSSAPLIAVNEISYTEAVPYECGFASGAGVWLSQNQAMGSAMPTLFENTIEYNTQSGLEDAGGNGGAGIAVWGGTAIIASNIIRYNSTGKSFSPAGGGSGGGLYFAVDRGLVLDNLIYGNTSNLAGGGVYLGTENGGTNGTLAFLNNTIIENAVVPVTTFSQAVVGGEQIYYQGGFNSAYTVDLRFVNNILGGSTASPSVVCYDGTINPVSYSHNDFYNTRGSAIGSDNAAPCTFPAGTNGNISADPLFASSAAQNYRPLASSPAVDTGDNASVSLAAALGGIESNDLAGSVRIQNAMGKNCTIDMGAYEFPAVSLACGVVEVLTSSLNPAPAGRNVTFTAQLSAPTGTPTGTVQFLDGATALGVQTVSATGLASLSTASLTAGSHTVTANYQATGAFSPASASLTEVIQGTATSTVLSCQPGTILAGGSALLTALVSSAGGVPVGPVAFSDNGSVLSTQALVNGSASLTYLGTAVQSHTITATYLPTGSYGGSAGSCVEAVTALPTMSVLTANPAVADAGATVVLSAVVRASAGMAGAALPTGTVTFLSGAAVVGTAAVAGTGIASIPVSSLPAGTDELSCRYSGDAVYASSVCNTVPVTVNAVSTTMTLNATPNPAGALTPVSLAIRLTSGARAVAGAAVTLIFPPSSALAPRTLTTDATGAASFMTSALAAGAYPVAASFSGTGTLQGSAASATLVVVANPTATSLTVTPNPADQNTLVTLSAVVTGPPTPSGTVTFLDGSTALGTVSLDATGHGSLSSRSWSPGSHQLTAVYAGTANFVGSSSSVVTLVIRPLDFTVQSDPTLTIKTEHHQQLQVTVVSEGSFADTVDLSCGNLPLYATCTFTQGSRVKLEAGGSVTTTVHVDTDQVYGYKAEAGRGLRRWPAGVVMALLLPGMLLGSRRRRIRVMSMTLLAGACLSMAACSGLYPEATPPGAYAITITGLGETSHLSHTSQTALTVTP